MSTSDTAVQEEIINLSHTSQKPTILCAPVSPHWLVSSNILLRFFLFFKKKVVFYQTSPGSCIAFFQTRVLGCRTSPVNTTYLQKLLVRRENSPAALWVLEDPVVLWDRYRPEMKKNILVSGKDLTGRQATHHFKMFLLNYTVCVLGKNSIKEKLHYLLPRSGRPLFWILNIYHQMQSD